MGGCHLEAFLFKSGTVPGKLGQVGLILPSNRSLHIGLAKLFPYPRFPVSGGRAESWKNLWADFAAPSQRLLFRRGAMDTLTYLPLIPYGFCLQGTYSGPGPVWTWCSISLSPPTHFQTGNWGPERPSAWFKGTQPGSSKAGNRMGASYVLRPHFCKLFREPARMFIHSL